MIIGQIIDLIKTELKNVMCENLWSRFLSLKSRFFSCATGAIALTCLSVSSASAQNLFEIDVTAGGTTESRSFDTAESILDALEDSIELSTINPNFSATTPGEVLGNFRGIGLELTYPVSNPANVLFEIPEIGFSRAFTAGATREENEDALVDYLESNADGILTDILNSLAANTATDPVAGNPTSLQGQSIASDYGSGTGLNEVNNSQGVASTGDERAKNLLGAAARLGRYTSDGVSQTVFELPLSYTIPLADPRYGIVLDAPITYVDTDGAESYSLSLGAGLRVPVFDNWTLTPAVRVGATGSIDLGSAAFLYSASLTSSYRWSMGSFDWELGNMVGYTETSGAIESGDLEIEYDLQNTVTKNGISVSKPTSRRLFGESTTWQFSIANTQIFGDDVFIENYTDVAFSYGTVASQNGLTWDSFRLGLTYTFTNEDYEGFRLNFGYQF